MSNKNTSGLIPFTKDGINGKTFEKWTEEVVHQYLDELESWLVDPIVDGDEVKENTNIFFMDFLITKRLYRDWVAYVCGKFPSVSERIEYFKTIQEQKLVSLGVYGKTNAPMTKFILQANYGYAEKIETKNENNNTTSITWVEEKTYDNGQ